MTEPSMPSKPISSASIRTLRCLQDNETIISHNINSEPKEGFGAKMSKALAGCGLCCFKLKEQTQISALDYKISNRQKKFGVDYLTLVERKSGQAALKECLKEALRDIAEVQTQINDHYDKIEGKEDEVLTKNNEAPAPVATSGGPKKQRAAKPQETITADDDAAPKKKGGKKKKSGNTNDE